MNRSIAQVHASDNGTPPPPPRPDLHAVPQGNWNPTLTAEFLKPLLARPRDGYWHFEMVHKTVVERRYECGRCHSAQLPFASVVTRQQRAAQTDVCVNCH
jgi:hypothetical protein